MKLERLKIASTSGYPIEVEGFVFGVWAATRRCGDIWSITHVPTGGCIGEAPVDREMAIAAAQRLNVTMPGWGADRAFGDVAPIDLADAERIRAAAFGPEEGTGR